MAFELTKKEIAYLYNDIIFMGGPNSTRAREKVVHGTLIDKVDD